MSQLPTIQAQPAKTKVMKPIDAPQVVMQTDAVMPTDAEMLSESEQIRNDFEWACNRNNFIGDVMLRAIVRENRQPTYAETAFFKNQCSWDDREIQPQINRMAAIIRYKSIAGSAIDRQAASDEKATAATILANEGPKIQEAIRKLQEQFDGLERNATRAERVVEQINSAVESLRNVEVLRSDLKAKYEAKRREFAANCWDRLNSVRVELDFREQMLETQTDKRKLLETMRRHFADCTKFDSFSHAWVVDEEKWTARKRMMALELIELRDEFDRLSATRDKQLAELDLLLDHYLDEK